MCKKRSKNDLKVECWNLDYYLLKWLEEHLKCYLEDASKVVDLEYYKYAYNGKEMTFKQVLELLIYDVEWLLNSTPYDYMVDRPSSWNKDTWDEEKNEIELVKNEIYDLLKLAHWQLWW